MALAALVSLWMLTGCAAETAIRNRTATPQQYAFWPPFPAQPRVQFLTSFAYSSDIEAPKSGLDRLVFGGSAKVLPINKPYGVGMWDGKIYVCDIRGDAVVVLDVARSETRLLVARSMGGMQQPVDIAIADDGQKYVADLERGVIFVFDENDHMETAFGFPGLKPAGVATHGDELYIADFGSQGVVILDRYTGEERRRFGGPGPDDGKFVRPLGIAVNHDGEIVVSDVIKARVQKFSPQGVLLSAFGQVGDTIGSFVRPKHIAIDNDGVTYVVDAAFQNVQMFDSEGHLLMFFGSGGGHIGAMNLPAGVAVTDQGVGLFSSLIHPYFDAKRLILVTNQFGLNKVSVYALGVLRPGRTPQDLARVAAPVPTGMQEDDNTPGSPTPVLPSSPDQAKQGTQPEKPKETSPPPQRTSSE